MNTNYGFADSATYSITDQEYVEFPVNFDLSSSLEADIEVMLDSGLIYQSLTQNQSAFTRNFIHYSNMRKGPVGGGLMTSNSRLPLGFRYRTEVGLSENTINRTYELFPNPTSSKAYLNWSSRKEAQLDIYSVTGKLERSYTVQKGTNVLDLHLKPGMYYLNFPAYPQVESRVLIIN